MTLMEQLRTRALDPLRATDQNMDEGFNPPIRHVASPPIEPERLFLLEQELGVDLPDLLRQVYTQVGDGNFGPGYGLMPLKDHPFVFTSAQTLPMYQALLKKGWPEHLLLFCYWGCTVYSVLNLQTEQVGIMDLDCWDDGVHFEGCIHWQKPSLSEWFEAWLGEEDLFFDGDGPGENPEQDEA